MGGNSKAIKTGERDIDEKKANSAFKRLPESLKENINENLKISTVLKENLEKEESTQKMYDEWVTAYGTEKRKVISEVKDGKMVYSVKKGNKYIGRNLTKERAAGIIAKFYISILKSQKRWVTK